MLLNAYSACLNPRSVNTAIEVVSQPKHSQYQTVIRADSRRERTLLAERDSDVGLADNEGWTPFLLRPKGTSPSKPGYYYDLGEV